jgi:2-iminoacetate synthase ThiH
MGPERAAALLASGCNDMGGSIMNESITRAAGALHGLTLLHRIMLHQGLLSEDILRD